MAYIGGNLRHLFVYVWCMAACTMAAPVRTIAQDPAQLMTDARALERKFREDSALDLYRQAYKMQPSNIQAAIKCAELSGLMGRRASGTIRIEAWLKQAMAFADAALKLDSLNADARFIKAVTFRHFAETEEKKDAATDYLRQWRSWAEKSLMADTGYAKAMHLLGCWHLEVLSQGSVRKATGKLLYGGLPEANINEAIKLMERCRDMEPYFCANFLDLAKAYHFNRNYEKAIATLERLAKLPTRRQDDVLIKTEGKALLQQLQ